MARRFAVRIRAIRDRLAEKDLIFITQKCPDVHNIVLSIKLRSPLKKKSITFEDLPNFPLICTVFLILGPFRLGRGGGGKPNFADKNFMGTQTFLNNIRAIRANRLKPAIRNFLVPFTPKFLQINSPPVFFL